MRPGRKWMTVRQDSMHAIKRAIRDELAADGMTQADLAATTGLTTKHVSQVLTGRIDGSFDVLTKMAAACGLIIVARRMEESPAWHPLDEETP